MGCWGNGSEENDATMDIVDGILEKLGHDEIDGLSDAERSKMWNTDKAGQVDFEGGEVGVVVFMVKHGVKMPINLLASAIADLEQPLSKRRTDAALSLGAFMEQDQVQEMVEWFVVDDDEERKQAVKDEIAMLRRCIHAGGQLPPVSTIGAD